MVTIILHGVEDFRADITDLIFAKQTVNNFRAILTIA